MHCINEHMSQLTKETITINDQIKKMFYLSTNKRSQAMTKST